MHISGTRFETPDPDAILELSGGTLSGLGIAFQREENVIQAEIEGVGLWITALAGAVQVSLTSGQADALAAVRAGVQARLAEMDPGLESLAWDGAGKAGDVPADFSFAEVVGVRPVSDDFLRMELAGADLGRFAKGGLHFRLLRQRDVGRPPAWPRISGTGTVDWPTGGEQLIHRIYTARHVDRAAHRLTFDILRHDGGPTVTWADGDPVDEVMGLMGPLGGGMPDGGWILLAGDETAQPAILRMLEELPEKTEGLAMVLAGAPGRETPVRNRTRIKLRWLYRSHGDDLLAEVLAAAVPERDDSFLWFAGEKSDARTVRQHFRDTLGQPRSRFTSAAYWE